MKKWVRSSLIVVFALSWVLYPRKVLGQNSSSILSATEHSGYTTLQDAFEKHCEITSTGAGTGYYDQGWSGQGWIQTTTYQFQVDEAELKVLKTAIASAKAGPISNGDTICDGGSYNISARVDTDSENFIVLKAMDCDQVHVNQSQAAQILRNWVSVQCKIKY